MPTKVNRQEFLHQLESVQPGLSAREIIEQSSCFCFSGTKVITYNDEISCRAPCGVELNGAVKAEPLLALLRKLNDDEIEISQDETHIIIEGKRKSASLLCEAKVVLPYKKVEKPGEWISMEEGWTDAITMVQYCASTDAQKYIVTCIHFTPDWIEATDNFQATRVKLKTGIKAPTLVRATSAKFIPQLGMTEVCESDSWMHFRNPTGVVLSIRRGIEDYPEISHMFKCKGVPITLPKGLGDAADRASVFSSDTTDENLNQVIVELTPDTVRVTGVGVRGKYTEKRAIKYSGPSFSFRIAPELLIELTKRHNEAEIQEGRIKVDGGHWRYVSALGKVADTSAP